VEKTHRERQRCRERWGTWIEAEAKESSAQTQWKAVRARREREESPESWLVRSPSAVERRSSGKGPPSARTVVRPRWSVGVRFPEH
jgi:hypothetical protein